MSVDGKMQTELKEMFLRNYFSAPAEEREASGSDGSGSDEHGDRQPHSPPAVQHYPHQHGLRGTIRT